MLQVGKWLEKWSRSKVSRKGKIAPSRKRVGKLELEQSKQEREDCSNRERSWRNGVGVKRAGNDD